MATLHYSSHRHEVDDPTGDLAIASHLLAFAEQWVAEARAEGDYEAVAEREAAVERYREEYAAMVANPGTGRLGQVDEGFRALGVGSYAS